MARVLICDHDPSIRTAVRDLAADHGHEVVGETADTFEVVELIERIRPDVAVVDVSLRYASGREVLSTAASCGCHAIIYSSYVDHDVLMRARGMPSAVIKPGLAALAEAIDRAASGLDAATQRRHADRHSLPGDDFFDALDAAQPGDAIVVIERHVPNDRELAILGSFAERTVAGSDRVAIGSHAIGILLAGSGPDGVEAVLGRLWGNSGRDPEQWDVRAAVIGTDPPAAAYRQLLGATPPQGELS
jgi:DNA-binding NarL/FixJ family response regulator